MKQCSHINVIRVSIQIMLVAVNMAECRTSSHKVHHGGRFMDNNYGALAGWANPNSYSALAGWANPNSYSMFGLGQSIGPTSIGVIQVNGKTEISLDGVNIDLSKANIVQDDAYNVVLSPIEAPGALITIGKMEAGKIIVDYKGQHYETIRPQDVEKMVHSNMAQMNLQMQEMRQQIQDMEKQMFSQFKFPQPFMGGMPGFFR